MKKKKKKEATSNGLFVWYTGYRCACNSQCVPCWCGALQQEEAWWSGMNFTHEEESWILLIYFFTSSFVSFLMMVLACQLHERVSSPVTLRNLQQKPLDADISIMLFVQSFGWIFFLYLSSTRTVRSWWSQWEKGTCASYGSLMYVWVKAETIEQMRCFWFCFCFFCTYWLLLTVHSLIVAVVDAATWTRNCEESSQPFLAGTFSCRYWTVIWYFSCYPQGALQFFPSLCLVSSVY